MKIKGKILIVTGGGNGMGRELVIRLIDKGATVAAVDMNKKALNETVTLAAAPAGKLSTHPINITDRNAVFECLKQIIEIHGHIDGIINNAGIIQPFVKIQDLDMDAIEKVMNVNFYGSLFWIQAVLPHLQQRPEAHIINVSSMGGFLPVPGQSVYGASKAAIKLLSEALYAELLSTNIKVSVVFPGAIATNITANSGVAIPLVDQNKASKFKAMSPCLAAKLILDGIEANKMRIYVGQDSKFMSFLYRISPSFATRYIAKKMKSLLDPIA